jgi:hypothetical protein
VATLTFGGVLDAEQTKGKHARTVFVSDRLGRGLAGKGVGVRALSFWDTHHTR